MQIMQGDQYPISFSLKDKNGSDITPSQLSDIEYILGIHTYRYSDGDITYADGKYQIKLTQETTLGLPVGAAYQQIRVKFSGADEWVKGARLDNVEILSSRSKAVL